VFDQFTVVGSLDPETGEMLAEPRAGQREDALPLALTIVSFP